MNGTTPMNLATAVYVDSSAMVAREIRRTLRSVDSMITALLIPVMILIVFTVIFGGSLETGGEYINYVVPGVLILCAGFGSASTSVSVALDMKSGTIDRFKTLPIYGSSVLVGHVIASVLRNLVSSALVLAVAIALGFRPDASIAGWLGAIGLLVLFILMMTWIACAVGLVLGPESSNGVSTIMLFLPYLSSGFVLTSTMPGWLEAFSNHQPLTPIIESIRALLMGSPAGNDAWFAIGWCLAIGSIAYLAASYLFRRRTAA
jgi:ABC-2 type transport system permease protein